MAHPILLAIDDNAGELAKLRQDLEGQFRDRLDVVIATSGEDALEKTREMRRQGDTVALFLCDERMPGMDGVDFLGKAGKIFPGAKRVLLIKYTDVERAIGAINAARADYYVLKPWTPPEERLLPALEDVLCDWFAANEPRFKGVRIVGHRWSAEAHELKDFLARNGVPYQWLDVEAQKGDPLVREVLKSRSKLPVVLLDGDERLEVPSVRDLAARIGLNTQAEQPFYDLAIVGGGPAGLAAAVYGASEGLSTVVIERDAPGGQAGMSSRIENYLGFPQGLSGADLARRSVDQAKRLGAEILSPQETTALCPEDGYRILKLGDGQEIRCHAVLLATGVSWRRLNVPGEERLYGKGVYYGASLSEAQLCRDENVYIVGGANSAGQGAIYFAKYARQVTMLVRGPSLDKEMSAYLVEQIEGTPNIEVRTGCEVVECQGEDHLSGLRVRCGDAEETFPADDLFVFIGAEPPTDWLKGTVALDRRGFVLSGAELQADEEAMRAWPLERPPMLMETSVPGVFVAGDVRTGSVKRVASSVGQGSIAVQFVHQYLAEIHA